VPADGTKAATLQNGDFGASPFFEQLSDKPQLVCNWLSGLSDAKHNSGSRNYSLSEGVNKLKMVVMAIPAMLRLDGRM
jgi:hypothetical protein